MNNMSMDYNLPVSLYRLFFFRGCKILMLPEIIPKHNLTIGTRFVDPPYIIIFFNSSLLWDVFIINSVEQLRTLPKTQSDIDISPFLKTQKPSILYIHDIVFLAIEGFCVFRNGLISISD